MEDTNENPPQTPSQRAIARDDLTKSIEQTSRRLADLTFYLAHHDAGGVVTRDDDGCARCAFRTRVRDCTIAGFETQLCSTCINEWKLRMMREPGWRRYELIKHMLTASTYTGDYETITRCETEANDLELLWFAAARDFVAEKKR